MRESDKGFEIIIVIAKDIIYSRLPRMHGNALDEKQNNTGAELNMTRTCQFMLFKVMRNIVSNPFSHKFIFSTKTMQNI